jgi:hypothetical protein
MPEYFDANGDRVDAFSLEEIEEKLNAAREEIKSEVKEEYEEQLTTLQEKIKEKEEEMEKIGSKDINFSNLRKIKEDLEKQLKKQEEDFSSKIKEFKEQTTKEKIESTANMLAGGDENLKKSIINSYNSFTGEPTNDEEFKKRMENACLLASGSKPTINTNAFSTGGYAPSYEGAGDGKGLSSGAKGIASQMGVTDEDIKAAEKQGLI